MSNYRRESDIAREAARVGGAIVRRHFGADIVARRKQSHNLVCDADLESEAAIARVIRESFPDHAILGEESHSDDAAAEHLWIVDPLDGTNNFFHRIEQFAVSVAYYHRGNPICGAIYDPLRDDLFTAVAGQGAFHNGARVRAGLESRLDEVIVAFGFYYDRGAMMEATLTAVRDFFRARVHGVRRFGAATLDLCGVALGRYGAFFELELAPWDFAAGRLFVSEAGGRVTTCLGEPPPLAKTSILATNGLLHEAALAVVEPHAASLGVRGG